VSTYNAVLKRAPIFSAPQATRTEHGVVHLVPQYLECSFVVSSEKNNSHSVHNRAANDGKNEKADSFLSIHRPTL